MPAANDPSPTPTPAPTPALTPAPVRRSVEIDGDLDDVWRALTEPEGLAAWLGAEVELDVRPGAAGRVVDRDGARREVLVTDVEPHRIAWHWWLDDGPLSSVEIVVVPTKSGTRVTVVERLEASRPTGPSLSASAGAAPRHGALSRSGRAGPSATLHHDGALGDPWRDTVAAWDLRLARLRVAAARPRHALVG